MVSVVPALPLNPASCGLALTLRMPAGQIDLNHGERPEGVDIDRAVCDRELLRPLLDISAFMETNDIYSAVVIQPEIESVGHRKEIAQNLNRYLELMETTYFVKMEVPESTRNYESYAPVRLVAFPEAFLTSFSIEEKVSRLDDILREVVIQIPGEETDKLGEKAQQLGIYICGCAFEFDPEWPDRFFNCAFILDPNGRVIHKYRKFNPAIEWELTSSPHDIFDEYVQRYGKGKSLTQTFFPVTETPIGKLGTLICNDGFWPEHFRALAMNGAEIIIRSNLPEPYVSAPMETWELQNRLNAQANMVYVVAPNTGLAHRWAVKCTNPGDSMIVDYDGIVIARTPYPGEAMTAGIIRLDHLRRRRADPLHNLLSQLRTEVLREIYKESVYPPNTLSKKKITHAKELYKRGAQELGVMHTLFKRGVFTRPTQR